jgi:hypothetical protein
MDLRAVTPALNLVQPAVAAAQLDGTPDPPAKFTFDDDSRRGQAIDTSFRRLHSIRRHGAQTPSSGAASSVHTGATVEDSVIIDNCSIGQPRQGAARDPGQERQEFTGGRDRGRNRPTKPIRARAGTWSATAASW